MTSTNMRLLGIHYHFPPVKTVGATRLHHFYTHLPPYAKPSHILTSSHHHRLLHDPALKTGGIHLHTLPAYDLRRLNLGGPSSKAAHVDPGFRRHPVFDLLARLHQSFPFNLLWGDGGLVYILAGYRRGCKIVERHGITHLFSSYRPYSDHAIAFMLKQRFPHLTWIADFRDLHVDPGRRNVVWPRLQRAFNHRTLGQADVLTTVSEGLAKSLKDFHPNVYVLRNGIGGPSRPDEKEPDPADKVAFRITYTGSLYPKKQSAALLFESLRQLVDEGKLAPGQLRFVYAGKDGRIWQSWLEKFQLSAYQETLGLVDLAEARRLQQGTHLNLLLSWSSPQQGGILTAKLYEYLNAGKPVLALIKGGPDPELTELVEGSGVGRVFNTQLHTQRDVGEYLHALFAKWRATGNTTLEVPEAVLAKRRWAKLMEDFLTFLNAEVTRK